jgi:hypothetical protein
MGVATEKLIKVQASSLIGGLIGASFLLLRFNRGMDKLEAVSRFNPKCDIPFNNTSISFFAVERPI